ncbi:hypothetical protein E1265_10500 [Streptomyces sp. 8K308]|uniref:hypothetical protein n=1 Tax=Streptomyces sp. 8K308 TaxID=2530388 RepID=UPI00104835B7|nr:hypothetical protein [Streptomyces sp. 8K308]TDC24189.1 hypothetical protein E1265_10500 [Streptomyces sp. 8K308]
MGSQGDVVAAEDVLLFVNAAITATGQREFHSDGERQRLSLDFLHEYMLVNYRDLYAATLALGINHHNTALIARRLLETAADAGSAERRRAEGRLIGRALRALPPQRVYRLFAALRAAGVNNRRTRAIVRDWLAARPDLAFDAVKYRGQLRAAARHAHLRLDGDGELGAFLFAPHDRRTFATPLFETWRRAHYDRSQVFELPYTVAEGLAARHGMDRAAFLAGIEPRMTRLEKLRLRETTGDRDQATLAGASLTRVAGYALSLPLAERSARRGELTDALRAAAARTAGRRAGAWGRTVAVLDDSYSAHGSGEKRRRPLAVALAAHFLLEALAGDGYTGLWTSGRTDSLLSRPLGPTPLGERILDALELAPERLLIVSDGWDNAPVGLAAEVLRVWSARFDPAGRVEIVHLNPVYDADDFAVRALAPSVPTVGVRDAEDLPALVELARFAHGRTELAALRAHLAARVADFIGEDA